MLPRWFCVVSLLALLVFSTAGALAAPKPPSVPGPVFSSDRPVSNKNVPQRWIVQLADPSMAQAPRSHPEFAGVSARSATLGKLQPWSVGAQAYRAFLQRQQAQLITTLRRTFPSAQVQRQYQVVFNGLSVMLPGTDAAAEARLRAMPGVVNVYADKSHKLQMFASIPQIGADQLWNSPEIGGQANAGAGIKIAVIDSGISIDNPFFNPAGFSYPEGFPKGDARFTTPKVIVARSYFRPDLPPLEGSELPVPGPVDSSHGTHVAGTAAGVGNTTARIANLTQTISGVAPRAYLMNYKVFYENDSPFTGQAFDTELVAALEDAVVDGADVINNSWGGRASVEASFDANVVAANAAVDAGVTVVFSAGNEGPDLYTAGSPGLSDKLITVGASTAAQTIAAGFVDIAGPGNVPEELTGQQYAQAAFGPPLEEAPLGPAPYVPVAAVAGSSLACAPLPAGSLSGQIALIERGQCEFSVKVYNAQLGGAIGVVVYNSQEGGEELIVMAAGTNSENVTIPSVFVARSFGLAAVEWHARNGAAAQLRIDPTARVVELTPDVLAVFSSRGPTFQGTLKPDVVAPGVNILSAGFAAGEGLDVHRGFGLVSGTSMAAPHVAGAAALLKQIHPDWSPLDVKSALMTTANPNVAVALDGTPATILERGAGRIDLPRAASPNLLFDRPSLSFGRLALQSGQATRAELAVTARNVSGQAQTYQLSATPEGDDLRIAVTPGQLTLAAGQSARITVAIEMPAGAGAGNYAGTVELASADNALLLPLYVQATPAERAAAKVLLIDNDGSSSLELRDYAGYYGNALGVLGIQFDYLDVDVLAGQFQTLPDLGELQRYEIVLWFTGDNFVPSGTFPVPTPLTETDQNLLIGYLQSGGNLIATGQDLSQASDINQNPPDDPRYGRSDLFHSYLGARFVQDNVFTRTTTLDRTVVGSGEQQWVTSTVLDLSPSTSPRGETGASNQVVVDEVGRVDIDPRAPDPFTRPIFKAVSASNQAGGVVALNRSDEPTLERPTPVIPYRTTYLGFGLEGVRNDTGRTTRESLLQGILSWTVARPSVTLDNSSVTVTDPSLPYTFTANAVSNVASNFVLYRFDLGDGSPVVGSAGPTVVHKFERPGTYQVRVEVTDNWGHKAVSAGTGSPPEDPIPQPVPPAQQVQPARAALQAGPKPSAVAFPLTKQVVQGRFLEHWRANGGLAVFGMPLGTQAGEPLSQQFERNRFEYHPENKAPYDVLLGRLGAEALAAQDRDWRAFPTVDSAGAGCRYFAETKHSLCGPFMAYWERHGLEFNGMKGSSYQESLALFGLPLSEPQTELVEGKPVLVQWFERARFEYHPENKAPYDVLLGRLGAEIKGSTR